MDCKKAAQFLQASTNRVLWETAYKLGSEAPHGGKKPWKRENSASITKRLLDAADSMDDILFSMLAEDVRDLCEFHGLGATGNKDSLIKKAMKFFNEHSLSEIRAAQDEYLKTLGSSDDGEDNETGEPSRDAGGEEENLRDSEYRLQGRPDHQRIQKALMQLAEIKGWFAKTNVSIGAGFRPDVLWYKLDPARNPGASFSHVFEIEYGQSAAVAKSLASLKHAHDLGCSKLFLLVPEDSMRRVESKAGQELRTGAFHEIRDDLKILEIGPDLSNHHSLAKKLGV